MAQHISYFSVKSSSSGKNHLNGPWNTGCTTLLHHLQHPLLSSSCIAHLAADPRRSSEGSITESKFNLVKWDGTLPYKSAVMVSSLKQPLHIDPETPPPLQHPWRRSLWGCCRWCDSAWCHWPSWHPTSKKGLDNMTPHQITRKQYNSSPGTLARSVQGPNHLA